MNESRNLGVPPEFKLISAAEVAEILSVSQSHLCAMRDMPDGGVMPCGMS